MLKPGPPFVLRFRFARIFFYFPTSNQEEGKRRHAHASNEWVESIKRGSAKEKKEKGNKDKGEGCGERKKEGDAGREKVKERE